MSQENQNNVLDHPNRYSHQAELNEAMTKKPNYVLRRLGAAAAATLTLVAAGSVAKSSMDYLHSDRDSQDIPSRTEVANPGDTLWELSKDVKNVDDRREVIDWMEKSSPDLADGSLDVGDHVTVPLDGKNLK